MPAFAYVIVMPPPIVPAPTTAARLMSRAGVSFGMSGTLATSRSAKNRWRSAFDSVDTTDCAKISRSRIDPSAKPRRRPSSIASTAASGARAPLAVFASVWRIARQASIPFLICSGDSAMSRVFRILRACAFDLANATAAVSSSARLTPSSLDDARDDAEPVEGSRPGRTSSRMPAALAFDAGTGLPSVHISSASCAPHSRGSRCVPPAPGMMPSSTSGWPTFASAVAMRK